MDKTLLVSERYATRQKRRMAVETAITRLMAIRDAERQSLYNTPMNFRETESYESGELAIDILDEAIHLLEDVY